MRFYPIWLWQNDTDQYQKIISWCSETQYGQIKHNTPFAIDYLTAKKSQQLRDKKNTLSLNDLVGYTVAQVFTAWLQPLEIDQYLQLHLINTLPEEWQKLPLEWCHWQGDCLAKRMQVIRYASLPKTTFPVYHRRKSLILNLWPQRTNQHQFFEHIIHDKQFKVIKGGNKATLHVRNHDLSDLALLCIIAHGNETHSEQPFFCDKQRPWRLPDKQLPPLVLLMACGGEQGNLLAYGRTLLKRGARTVLAAQGKLDASQTTLFLRDFIRDWKTGLAADQILYHLQQKANAQVAAQRIYVLGQSHLRHLYPISPQRAITDWSTLKRLALGDNGALQQLLNQLTLHHLVSYSRIDALVAALYRALQLDYNDPHEKKNLLYDRLTALYPHCLPLTKKWLSYFLVYLSSIHEHRYIAKYHQETIRLQRIQISGSELLLFYMANGSYRSREHERAMQILLNGINSLLLNNTYNTNNISTINATNTNVNEASYKLLELAINISSALALPELGMFFLEYVDEYLLSSRLTEEQYANETFTQLDREARLYVAQGDRHDEAKGDAGFIQGIQILEKKRLIAIHARSQTGERELCLILYLSAWLKNNRLPT